MKRMLYQKTLLIHCGCCIIWIDGYSLLTGKHMLLRKVPQRRKEAVRPAASGSDLPEQGPQHRLPKRWNGILLRVFHAVTHLEQRILVTTMPGPRSSGAAVSCLVGSHGHQCMQVGPLTSIVLSAVCVCMRQEGLQGCNDILILRSHMGCNASWLRG